MAARGSASSRDGASVRIHFHGALQGQIKSKEVPLMSQRSFACLGFAAVAVAVLLIAADPASAQRFGRSGFYSGYGYGYGNPYYSGYGPGYGYGWGYNPGYTRGWGNNYPGGYSNYPGGYSNYPGGYSNYPGYSRGWAYNNYYPEYSGAWWNAPGYSGSTGGYYGEGMQGGYYSSTPGATPSSGTMAQGTTGQGGFMDGQVLINVRVPPNAEVWFDDQKTSQTGPTRSFITPPLNPDHDFVYHIRARWTENGRQVEKTRRIDVHAGDRLFVNFMGRRQEGMQGTPSGAAPTYGAEPGTRGEDRALEQRDRTLENRERNLQQNPDRTLDNRTQPGQTTPPTKTNSQPRTPPNNQPPEK
jgi:uncharacterized protein (TIGR03000 family)